MNLSELYNIMNEKAIHGKDINANSKPAVLNNMQEEQIFELYKNNFSMSDDDARKATKELIDQTNEKSKMSMQASDVIQGRIEKELETYDKQLEERVMNSKNIVDAYNAMISADFDKALEKSEEYTKALLEISNKYTRISSTGEAEMDQEGIDKSREAQKTSKGLVGSISAIQSMLYTPLKDGENFEGKNEILDEYKKYIINMMYFTSDDPEKIKHHLKLRQNYNATMIKIFQIMLRENYTLLNMEKNEAYALSLDLGSNNQTTSHKAISELKQIVIKNKHKFDNGKFIDFRSIGGGVIYVTKEFTGLEHYTSIERLLQSAMRYDAVVFGHGGDSYIEDLPENERNKYDKKEWGNLVWSCQPIYTENGGPFTDMNKLVRQCISEGKKKILILSCNPGHHVLEKDIQDSKKILIKYGMNSVLMTENTVNLTNDIGSMTETEQECSNIEQHLISICNECNIDYNNDELNKAWFLETCNMSEFIIDEGVGQKIWTTLKEICKKVLAGIIWLFKKMIELIRKMIEKIKTAFKNFKARPNLHKEFSKPIKTRFIMIESATIQTSSVKSWDGFETGTIKAIEQIAKKIEVLEHGQTEATKRLQSVIEQNEKKSLHETTDNLYELYKLANLL